VSNNGPRKPMAHKTLVSLADPSVGGFHVKPRIVVMSDAFPAPAENRTHRTRSQPSKHL
jgi:hypothetical protein